MKTKTKPNRLLPDCKHESIETLIWNPIRLDGGWVSNWEGIETEDGELLHVSCDCNGNWDYDGWGEPATQENYDAAYREILEQSDDNVEAYHEYCLKHGEDPLHEYYVSHETERKENYIAYATKWVGSPEHGMAVSRVRGARTHLGGDTVVTPDKLPPHVADFLGLHKVGDRYCMEGIHDKGDICSDCVGYVGDYDNLDLHNHIFIKFQVTRKRPRPTAQIKRDIRKIAKLSLAR